MFSPSLTIRTTALLAAVRLVLMLPRASLPALFRNPLPRCRSLWLYWRAAFLSASGLGLRHELDGSNTRNSYRSFACVAKGFTGTKTQPKSSVGGLALQSEDFTDELNNLAKYIVFWQPPHLALPDHIQNLVRLNRSPCGIERSKALVLRIDSRSRELRAMPVWPKYSSGAEIISKQTVEALAATDISATRFQGRGREED